MSFSRHKVRRPRQRKHSPSFLFLATILIVSLGGSLSPVLAEAAGKQARSAIDSAIRFFGKSSSKKKVQTLSTQEFKSPSDRAAEVKHLRLCPRRLQLHVEEGYTLVPLPLDIDRKTIHGAEMTWSSSNPSVASVASYGGVEAKSPGSAVISVQIGKNRANVIVEVVPGVRPRISDSEWDQRHAHDCDDPEALVGASLPAQPAAHVRERNEVETNDLPKHGSIDGDASRLQSTEGSSIGSPAKVDARPALMRRAASVGARTLTATRASLLRSRPKPGLPQGEAPPEIFPQALFVQNVIGSPRFSPLETTGGATKLKNNLGSSNYGFAAPALSLGGRGVGVSLSLIYNSQLWNNDGSGAMRFNYNKGMIAEGWNIGYGRIIRNYDGTALGDGSSIGLANNPGGCLLIQGDGTRVQFVQRWDSVNGVWNLESDGDHTFFNPRSLRLRYNDGTLVRYFVKNNKLLPNEIKTRNGDVIAMEYRDHDPVIFPNRFSLDRITDTLGRIIQFYYYGDPGYPADPANGKPLAALAAIKTPDLLSGQPREVVRVEYQTLTLQYDFSPNFTIDGPANNSPITVVKRIYYPATGRGYLFLDYSTYGMCRQISVRKDMTGTGGVITDGTEVAYTKYNYPNASDGQLNHSPEYTSRKEWWQGHPNGSSPTEYTYSRDHTPDIEIDTVSVVQPVTGALFATMTTSVNGQVQTVLRKIGEADVLNYETYAYNLTDPSLLESVSITNEAGQTAGTSFEYNVVDFPYGRVTKMYESGFDGPTIRRTEYAYSDATDHVSVNLTRLVTNVGVFDHQTNEKKQKTVLTYDDYSGGMQTYASIPNTHDSSFDTGYTKRGNVTGVETFSSVTPPVSTTRLSKFDIFGNVVEADVSCCQVKTFAFSLTPTWYSQPDLVTNGRVGVTPFLTTAYSYDYNTGLVLQMTDPDNGITGYQYDSAWRLLMVSTPTGAQITTTPDRTNGNDQLSYVESATYPEGLSSKTTTKRRWFDGAGRELRAGAGAGASPTTYDSVATEYDALGRVSRMSNPYLGNTSGIGTPTAWTSNEYDNLSRVKKVTLPDQQTIQTGYNGSETTVTDQVGRKKRSVVDGLGRPVSVTEQDTTTGSLTVTTGYTYNAVDNLLEINQGGQIRSFIYDMLGRAKSETTPEGGTVTFTYTDFDAMLKQTHTVRGVETHYGYDSLNRPNKVWYTGLGGNDSGSIRPALPSSVAATSDVDVTYRSSAPGNGQPSSVSDGQIAGFSSSESYAYESLTGRLQSRTRAIDGTSYQTEYQYNGVNQTTLMIYPSGKRARMNYDSRGRMLGEEKVDTGGSVLTTYASDMAYDVSGLLSGMNLGNGVNETYGYSSDRLQLTGQTAVKGNSSLMNLTYGYAAAAGDSGATTTAGNSGQLMGIGGTIASAARNQTFTYDNVARLKTANGWSAWSQGYSYDNKNNLTSVSGTQAKTISVDPATNRILNVNGTGYGYDAAGNVTSDGVHNYQYDAAGRLAKVDAGSGNEAAYSYDFQNWRVKKVFNSNTTNYIWEEGRVIAEYSSAQPQGPGGIKYYLSDRLSTRATSDSSGAVISTQDHLPFGEDISSTGQPEKHRFTNYERDIETGTDYAVNRQYAANVGRFLQADPVAGTIGVPQSLNRYAYVQNDPINSVDPEGLFPFLFPYFSFGSLGSVTVWAQYDPIVVISSGIGPLGPGPLLPVISIDVLSLLPPLPTPQQKAPCPPVPQHPKDADIDANIRRSQQHRPSGPFTAYGDAVWFRDMVKANAPWDYKRLTSDLRYEDFGNFNYGAAGAAIGFPLITLHSEAGRAQGIPPGMSEKPKAWGYPAGRFFGKGQYPYGDEPKDAIQIAAGFNYYVRKFVRKDCQ